MIVFKTFWKILNNNKLIVIIFSVILIIFGISNINNDDSINFSAQKPNIYIVNQDENEGITKDLIRYIKNNAEVNESLSQKQADDALFYRQVDYIIYIPKKFRKNFLNGNNPEIKVKSTGDYNSYYAEMLVSRYIEVANSYRQSVENEDEMISNINKTLDKKVNIELITKFDKTPLEKVSFYYNFASYSLLVCIIYIIGIILNSFNKEKIKKRIIISSMNYKKHNRILFLANCCYSILLWGIYVSVSLISFNEVMFSKIGLIYILNSLLFTICITSVSFLIGIIVDNKEALSGISNVISLGSSFLCGVFVSQNYLPNFVIKIAHIIPTFYYVESNNKLVEINNFNIDTLKPIINNMLILIWFTIIFIILTNIISYRKRKF